VRHPENSLVIDGKISDLGMKATRIGQDGPSSQSQLLHVQKGAETLAQQRELAVQLIILIDGFVVQNDLHLMG
jgi:hypothetical protein